MPDDKTEHVEQDDTSPLDRLAVQSGLENDESPEPAAEPEPKPAAPSFDSAAFETRVTKAEERAFAAEQRATFLAGRLSLLEQNGKPKPEEPKQFVFNKDEFAAQLEKDPAAAIHDLIQTIAADKARGVGKEVKGEVDNRFNEFGRGTQRTAAFQQDRDETRSEFADVVDNRDFQEAANIQLYKLVARRVGKRIEEVTERDFAPGDFYAAAAATYAQWAKSDKLPKVTPEAKPTSPRSIREIIASAPKNDGLGTPGASRGTNGKVALSDLYPEKELPAVRKIMKEFGATEAEWIASMQAAGREDEAYGN